MNIITELFRTRKRDLTETLIEEGEERGFPYAIIKGPFGWCAYVAIPEDHEYAKYLDYMDIPLECNGGVTFAEKYKDKYILGWDYSHSWNVRDEATVTSVCGQIIEVVDQLLS